MNFQVASRAEQLLYCVATQYNILYGIFLETMNLNQNYFEFINKQTITIFSIPNLFEKKKEKIQLTTVLPTSVLFPSRFG